VSTATLAALAAAARATSGTATVGDALAAVTNVASR
jgi:hypothetical protein